MPRGNVPCAQKASSVSSFNSDTNWLREIVSTRCFCNFLMSQCAPMNIILYLTYFSYSCTISHKWYCVSYLGITSRLDHFVDAGVGAIWMSPIFVSPMVDFGYDISDFYNIQPEYGTMEDFEELVEKAHELGKNYQ